MRCVRKSTGRLALVMAMSLSIGVAGTYKAPAAAKAKPKINATGKTLKVKESFTLKAKNIKKVTWSASNKKIKLSSKKKTSVKVTAVKAGKAKVTAAYKLSGKKKTLKCNITISNTGAENAKATSSPDTAQVTQAAQCTQTSQPTSAATSNANNPTQAPTAVPTEVPSPTPVPTEVPTPSVVSESGSWSYIPVDNDSLLKEFGPIFGNVGTCLTYNDGFRQQLEDKPTMEHVRKNYNSFTLENDMKPSFLLSDSLKNFRNPVFNQLITVNDAIAQGYYIPDNYTEYDVPEINYTNIDKIMQIAADNGIRMRAHTLIWHSQTPTEFFREGYQTNGSFVDPATMDQRIIYYVTNVVKHICESPNSSVVYTWDICNEYFHQSASGNDANWAKVYDLSSASGLTTTPSYVKLAFKTGYDVLKKYNLQDSVPLFYNDYNTSQVADKIVEMVNYINSKDEINPDGEKICAGVGMQCHLGLKWPSVEEQLGTVQKFLDAGFEVQITELDIVNDNGSTEAQYCDYWYYFMKGLVDRRVAGAKITGVTFWGLCDDVSWRFGQSALLYGKSINDPKKNLYAAYAAAQSSWGLK